MSDEHHEVLLVRNCSQIILFSHFFDIVKTHIYLSKMYLLTMIEISVFWSSTCNASMLMSHECSVYVVIMHLSTKTILWADLNCSRPKRVLEENVVKLVYSALINVIAPSALNSWNVCDGLRWKSLWDGLIPKQVAERNKYFSRALISIHSNFIML